MAVVSYTQSGLSDELKNKIRNAIPNISPSISETQVVDLSIDTLYYFIGLEKYSNLIDLIQNNIKNELRHRLFGLSDFDKQIERFDNKQYSSNPPPVDNRIKLEFESIDYHINPTLPEYDRLLGLANSLTLLMNNFSTNENCSSRVHSTFAYLRQVVRLPRELIKYAESDLDYFLYLLTSWMFEKIGKVQKLSGVCNNWDCSNIEYRKRYWKEFSGVLYGKIERDVVNSANSLFSLWFNLALHMFTCSRYFELCQVLGDGNFILLPRIFFATKIAKEGLEIDEQIRVCWDISKNIKTIQKTIDNEITENGAKMYNNIDTQALVFVADTMTEFTKNKFDGIKCLVDALRDQNETIPLDTFQQKYWMIIKLLNTWDMETNSLKGDQSSMVVLDHILNSTSKKR